MKRLVGRGSRIWVYDRLRKLAGGARGPSFTVTTFINHKLRFRLLDVYETCLYFERRGLG